DIVDLNTSPIKTFTENGIMTSDGKEREYDYVILATGFESFTGRYVCPEEVDLVLEISTDSGCQCFQHGPKGQRWTGHEGYLVQGWHQHIPRNDGARVSQLFHGLQPPRSVQCPELILENYERGR